jgi:hypothetical protein
MGAIDSYLYLAWILARIYAVSAIFLVVIYYAVRIR